MYDNKTRNKKHHGKFSSVIHLEIDVIHTLAVPQGTNHNILYILATRKDRAL